MLMQTTSQAATPRPAMRAPQGSRNAPARSGTADLVDQMDLMGAPMPFSRNAEIYGESEPAHYVYKVVSGAARTYKIFDDGRRQIGAFYFPGEVFGLELGDEHEFSAEAIDNSVILVVKRSALVALADRDPDMARRLWSFTAGELQRLRRHMLLFVKSAEERVACFLLEMSGRLASAETVDLPMSRQDIADYLGLTIETVSRTLTQLETKAAIALPKSRRIVLRNRNALNRLDA
jgi:CRP/FNR family nitrogen fixation transcriptional regulator